MKALRRKSDKAWIDIGDYVISASEFPVFYPDSFELEHVPWIPRASFDDYELVDVEVTVRGLRKGKRKPGYYRVMYHSHWYISYYCSIDETWVLNFDYKSEPLIRTDSDFGKIIETPIIPAP